MTLDEVCSEWERDCKIDVKHVGEASSMSPMLHAKYIRELSSCKLRLYKEQVEILRLKELKRKYFRGQMTSEELQELGWDQWQYKMLKTDVEEKLNSDPDVAKMLLRESYIKTMISTIESILGEIRTRSFHCKNIIEDAKFKAGA